TAPGSVDKPRAGPSRRPRKDGASSGRTDMTFGFDIPTARPEEPPYFGGVSKGTLFTYVPARCRAALAWRFLAVALAARACARADPARALSFFEAWASPSVLPASAAMRSEV